MNPAPYPPDTRAKGWRFELDYEQIEQSETWPLAAEIPMAQHALLMMWMVAWSKQVPCGSFPNDESVIRAACRVPPAVWAKCRDVLMRGWWPADDGRLYHPTLTKRVLEMMRKRRSDSDRQAAKRMRDTHEQTGTPPEVTPVSRVTPSGVHSDSSTDHRPPNTEEEKPKTPPNPRKRGKGFDAALIDVPEWLDAETWQAWCRDRASRGKAITELAAKLQLEKLDEYRRNGTTPESVLRHAIASGNQGLYAPPAAPKPANGHHAETPYQRAARERVAAFAPSVAARAPTPQSIPAEIIDVTPRLVG